VVAALELAGAFDGELVGDALDDAEELLVAAGVAAELAEGALGPVVEAEAAVAELDAIDDLVERGGE